MSELLKKLADLYGKAPKQVDMFGRRPALPSEIGAVIQPKPEDQLTEADYQPTAADLKEKGDGGES